MPVAASAPQADTEMVSAGRVKSLKPAMTRPYKNVDNHNEKARILMFI